MSRRDALRFHTDRAFQELDCARGASCDEAAVAHLALSELHLVRTRELREAAVPALRLVRPTVEEKAPLNQYISVA